MDVDMREPETALPDFDTFFRETFATVARSAALVARDAGAGQDAAQEAFFRLYERWPRIESRERGRRFAFRVGINLARSHVRKVVRVTRAGLRLGGEASQQGGGPDDWLALREALAGLSPRRRGVAVLVDYVGMDAAEAGATLGISAGTVRAHLMRARRDLRTRLGLGELEVTG